MWHYTVSSRATGPATIPDGGITKSLNNHLYLCSIVFPFAARHGSIRHRASNPPALANTVGPPARKQRHTNKPRATCGRGSRFFTSSSPSPSPSIVLSITLQILRSLRDWIVPWTLSTPNTCPPHSPPQPCIILVSFFPILRHPIFVTAACRGHSVTHELLISPFPRRRCRGCGSRGRQDLIPPRVVYAPCYTKPRL